MPKKFKGENSKAVEAKARKEALQVEENDRKQKAADDAYWADDDKLVNRKQQRKTEREQKHAEQMRRKQEAQTLLDEETSCLPTAKPPPPSSKVTRAQIANNKVQVAAAAAAAQKAESMPVTEQPLEENLNRLDIEGEARGVEEAISVLSTNPVPAVDMHPEKRVKAAYAEFESRRLPEVKADNPGLRLSQMKQIIKKEWQKSPDNPLNQR